MKLIIYAGIGLFSAASIYGVADYFVSSKNGIINKLYKEEGTLESKPLVVNKTLNQEIPVDQETGINKVAAKRTVLKEQRTKIPKFNGLLNVKLDNFSRGKIDWKPLMDSVKPFMEININTIPEENVKAVEEKTKIEKAEPDKLEIRKLDLSKFSRAPLRIKKAKPGTELTQNRPQ